MKTILQLALVALCLLPLNLSAQSVLYISGYGDTSTAATDVQNLLTTNGFTYTYADRGGFGGDLDTQYLATAQTKREFLNGFDAIVISRSTGSSTFGTGGASDWAELSQTILSLSPFSVDELGWYDGGTGGTAYKDISNPDTSASLPSSALLDGVTLDANDDFSLYIHPPLNNTSLTFAGVKTDADLGDGTIVALSTDDPTVAHIVSWDPGDDMFSVSNIGGYRFLLSVSSRSGIQDTVPLSAAGEQVFLNTLTIPEPSAFALLTVGAGLFLLLRRRRIR